jgi:outer membrane protein
MSNTLKLIKLSAIVLFLIMTSCVDYKGLVDPYSKAPASKTSIWQNPSKKETPFTKATIPNELKDKKLTLAELLDIGLINNPITYKTWAMARSAASSYASTLSSYFPEADLIGTYTREKESVYSSGIFGHTKPVHYYQTIITPEASLSYTIFDFGLRKSTSAAALQTFYYAGFIHNQQLQAVTRTIMDDYYNYQYQKQLMVANEADLENARMSLDSAQQKFIAGIASVGDVTQAKTKYLEMKLQLISQENVVKTTFANLAKDLGLDANNFFDVQEFPKEILTNMQIESIDSLVFTAQTQRQDYLAMQSQISAKEELVKQAKAESLPLLTTDFDIGRNYYNGNVNDDYHFTLGFKISFPLFRGFYFKNKEKQAQANLEQAMSSLTQTKLTIIGQITIAHNDVLSAKDTMKCSEEYLKEAKKRFDIALASYKAGTVTILDVIAAQSSLADARAQKVKAEKDWFASLSNLAYATGSLSIPLENEEKNEN